MRVADFFCGSGGFSEGFRQAGFEIVFAVDKWAPAVETYKGNKPEVNAIKDDVIRISLLPDEEFEKIVPDTEIIIGSPPCQSFSSSNKAGNADKSLGIKLIEAYLRIIARKKFKKNSILKYWVLENVPGVVNHIKEEYTADDLGLKGEFVLKAHSGASGKYNAKFFGAPTNRERYFCGEFPEPQKTRNEENAVTLRQVLDSLGEPCYTEGDIEDINYPGLVVPRNLVTDHHYIYELAEFEWKTAERLKRDKGYMGKMSFPENLDKPSRTVMATMSASSREAMILQYKNNRYRLPTVREAASMMSFPIDYWFYGKSKATKHTLVGNAVPPKMSYAIAKAIADVEGREIPSNYCRIHHDEELALKNLNGETFEVKKEKSKRGNAKFKYHIPYLIINAYRVEITNYNSNFNEQEFVWNAEIHHSQGKINAKVFTPEIEIDDIEEKYKERIEKFVQTTQLKLSSYNLFQYNYCRTNEERKKNNLYGPYELLNEVKDFLSALIPDEEMKKLINIKEAPKQLPTAIGIGYYILSNLMSKMGGC